MQISLKSIIREAFNTAYDQYKSGKNIIKESSERLGALLTPEEKAKADQILNNMVTQSPGWDKYQWSPNGGQGINQKEWNYIIEKIFELYKATGDDIYKKIIGNAYTYSPQIKGVGEEASIQPSALYNAILPRLLANSGLERLMQKDPDSLNTLLSKAWGRIFAGGKIDTRDKVDSNGNIIKKGEKNVDAWKALVDGYNSTDSNFGAYLYTVLFNDTKDLANLEAENITSSLDAPNNITGKPSDVEGEDDSIVGGADPGLGDNFDDDNDNDFNANNTYISNNSSNTEESQIEAIKKVDNWNQALEKTIRILNTTDISEKAKITFKEIMQDFLTFDEIAEKHPDWMPRKHNKVSEVSPEEKLVASELKNKHLINAANTVLAPYGLDYSIFNNSNWDEQFMGLSKIAEAIDNSVEPLNPYDIVEKIINLFSQNTSQGTSAKNKTINVFKQYALNHKTPSEIATILGLTPPKPKEVNGGDYIKSIIQNLAIHNEKFDKIAYNAFREKGFDINFAYFNWMDYVKAGKALRDEDQQALVPHNQNNNEPEDQKYVWEEIDKNFIKENYDTIIKMVYKKLSKNL